MRTLCFFFLNDTAPTRIYTLSLHDALPIPDVQAFAAQVERIDGVRSVAPPVDLGGGTWQLDASVPGDPAGATAQDRKSTRLNSSHANISYAVFCLKKKKYEIIKTTIQMRSN